MLKITHRSDHHHGDINDQIELPFSLRQKGRFKTHTKKGEEVGVFLVRGEVLRDGDCLYSECGKVFKVEASAESVVTAVATDWLNFAKTCYHLGNRHVPMEIGEMWVRFQPDHVLEEMVERFGLKCNHHQASFTPESGAYHSGGHHHSHGEHTH